MPQTADATDAPIGGSAAASIIDPREHVDWAERIGHGVARHHGFRAGSVQWEDVRAEAVQVVIEKARRPAAEGGFDPAMVPPGGDFGGAFRGWAKPSVRARCDQEAVRLKNGGTFHRRQASEREPVRLTSLFAPAAGGDGDTVFLVDTIAARESPEPPDAHEPGLYITDCPETPPCPNPTTSRSRHWKPGPPSSGPNWGTWTSSAAT